MKKVAVFIIVLFVVAFSIFFVVSRQNNMTSLNTTQSPSPTSDLSVDFRAGFTIYTRGTRRIFSDPKYHNRSKNVYLEAVNPNIIVVKKRLTWKEFFDSLPSPFQLEENCLTTGAGQLFCSGENGTLKFILNGEQVSSILTREIRDGDKLLVSYGSEAKDVLQEQFESIQNPQ